MGKHSNVRRRKIIWRYNQCTRQMKLKFCCFISEWTRTPTSKKNCYLLQYKPFKNDENAFYFILKALFVLRYLSFCNGFLVMYKRHNLKSGPGTRDPGPWDLRSGTLRLWTLRPGTLELGPRALGLVTLGYGILTPGNLVMGPWGPVTSNWPPPQIVLTLFVKQILRGHGMCLENVGARTQK